MLNHVVHIVTTIYPLPNKQRQTKEARAPKYEEYRITAILRQYPLLKPQRFKFTEEDRNFLLYLTFSQLHSW
jgi:hypothetical protein